MKVRVFIFLLGLPILLPTFSSSVFAQNSQSGGFSAQAGAVWPEVGGWHFTCESAPCTDDKLFHWGDEISAELVSAGNWFESLGFRLPNIDIAVHQNLESSSHTQYYVAHMGEVVTKRNERGWGSVSVDGEFKLDPSFLLQEGSARGSHVHELFHAVQLNYQNFSYETVALDWIAEGTADAAAIQWIINEGPRLPNASSRESLSLLTLNDNRPFDESLYADDTYATSLFWRRVGTDLLESDGGIGYLNTILEQPILSSHLDNHGLIGVHQGFKALASSYDIDGLHDGLYYVFPWFFTTPNLGSSNGVVVRDSIFLPQSGEVNPLKITGTIKPVAGNPIIVETDAAGNQAYTAEVRLLGDSDDLHLIVNRTLYNFPDGVNSRNFSTFTDLHGEHRFTVWIVNIAKEPQKTDPADYELTIELFRSKHCGHKRNSLPESTGASRTTDVQRLEGKMIVSGHALAVSDVSACGTDLRFS